MDKVVFEFGNLRLRTGAEVFSVATFNNGFSHIVVDDNDWVIANGHDGDARFSSWIFPEAMEVLKQLPNSPLDYQPYAEYRKIFHE